MKKEYITQDEHIEKCRNCGGDMKLRLVARGYDLYNCPICSFEQIRIDISKEATEYDAQYFNNSKYVDVHALQKEHSRRLKLMEKYVNKGCEILDYGCAAGEFVEFASQVYDMDGCDISTAAIEMAKRKYADKCDRFFSIKEALEDNKKYDAICLWDVIEHIDYPNSIVTLLRGKIKEGGFVILSTPDIGSFFSKLTKSRWPFMTPPEHLCFFNKKSMRTLAIQNGFDMKSWKAKGKWANVGFILYKFNRVSKRKIPKSIVELFGKGFLKYLHVYVPTRDIQYVVLQKK